MCQLRSYQSKIRKFRNCIGSSQKFNYPSDNPESDMQLGQYLEPLKPPMFSGRLEDWCEFCSIWKNLFVEVPEKIQVHYFKKSIPPKDLKHVKGVMSMKDLWARLDAVYGNIELNVLTIKSKLEGLHLKASLDHEKMIELYHAVEYAVTHLVNIGALDYLHEDFRLINRLVMKLPLIEQNHYSVHVTSNPIATDKSSSWEKFWQWLKNKYNAAVHTRLMHTCFSSTRKVLDDSINSKSSCKVKHSAGRNIVKKESSHRLLTSQLKVPVVSTRTEYKKLLPAARKSNGSCPACGTISHNYMRQSSLAELICHQIG